MRATLFSVLSLLFILQLVAQVDLSYYLPEGLSYNPDIPTPKEVLGYSPGEWHVSHDQLIYYMRTIADASERAMLVEYAISYEGRPLMHVIFTSVENQQNLEQIKAEHLKLTIPDESANLDTKNMPIVMWIGYSVHGNEASGANAALITAYYLAATQGDAINELLDNSIILVDPCYNPDGVNRFASWVNMHRSHVINPDPNDREYREVWPGGRTNHYWFDLNRDWLPLQHPESRGRIARFHEWKPNILTDHHEMGTSATFFFQPGIPSRKFPWTPQKNVDLTKKMAAFHAQYLDKIGSLYYSEESFDDFYVGKGSTYPDINGSVGILFEQASARGHAQENPYGVLTLPLAIRNQFTTTLSTLASGLTHRREFLDYQRNFYQDATRLATKDAVKAYVFGSQKDPVRNFELLKILRQHKVDVYQLGSSINTAGQRFNPESSYVVPLDQPQYRLVRAIFETRTTFNDSLFYDVSTWTMPLAFNLSYAELDSRAFGSLSLGDKIEKPTAPKGQLVGEKGAYAYAVEPYGYYAFRAIHRLLSENVKVMVLNELHGDKNRTFPRGTMIIPIGVQEDKRAFIERTIETIVKEDAIHVYALKTGLRVSGTVDLGSRSNDLIKEPKVAVLVHQGVSGYEAGEVWHFMDQRLKMKVTLLPTDRLGKVDISKYNRIVLPNGSYSGVSAEGKKALKMWLQKGGVAIAWKNGGKWLSDNEFTQVAYEKATPDTIGYKPYEKQNEFSGAQVTGGAIFEAEVDTSHPLAYGLERNRIPLFRNHNLVIKKSKNPYAHPLRYTASPLLSGYVSEENLERLKNTPATQVSNVGYGKVITLTDNPNFRAFWYGTNKLYMNALFFGTIINRSAGE